MATVHGMALRVVSGGVMGLCWAAGLAQGGGSTAPSATQLYHPAGPLPSYEVATIKKPDPKADTGPIRSMMTVGQSVKNYILSAYGASPMSPVQVEGPDWIAREMYVIQGKPSAEEQTAISKMSLEDRQAEMHKLQQALLAERFKLKAHIETREMAVFDLMPAKGGVKVKEVPAPPPFVPPAGGGAPPPVPLPGPGRALLPGMVTMRVNDGATTMNAKAMTMRQMVNVLRQSAEVGGKPIVDKTGFAGAFDVNDMVWAGMPMMVNGGAPPTAESSAPSIFTAVEETLGVKLVAAKGLVEVLVIDSIERPTEN